MTTTADDRQPDPFWVVQDVFSGGLPGPGFTRHTNREEAATEAAARRAVLLEGRQCSTCAGVIGLDGVPLQGGCNDCR